MELALSLGDPSVSVSASKPFPFLHKKQPPSMGLALSLPKSTAHDSDDDDDNYDDDDDEEREKQITSSSSSDHLPLQLDLLPFSPLPRPQIRFPWLPPTSDPHLGGEPGPSETKRKPQPVATATSAEEQSSPNSAGSSFMEFSLCRSGPGFLPNKRFCSGGPGPLEPEPVAERTGSRGSDDEENASTRKKLRLSKEQSAFLEESFKEHHTLNPKQKQALAKQLNLRPRQVEVWFQNRRARTKLKQTEVDCEYLKRCCETLTDENRRLQKELHELRALKASQPFYMQLPATTLTMCPSCERVAPTSSAAAAPPTSTNNNNKNNHKPSLPFGGGPHAQSQAQAQAQVQAHKVVSS